MNLFNVIAVFIVIATVFAYINRRFLKLPNNIGVMIIAIVVSILLLLTSRLFPTISADSVKLISSVDFTDVIIGVVLNFLLFAGTIQIKIKDLRAQQLPVVLFSTIGVVISTFIVGGMLFGVMQLLKSPVSIEQCLLFGALISPTDPVSVLGVIKDTGVPKSLETKIAGESIFNDGVALVIFVTILHAIHNPGEGVSLKEVSHIFLREAVGALVLGVALGFVSSGALRTIDDYKVEVMITIAVVMGGYILAKSLSVSAPLTMVSAGIFIGNYGKKYAMSDVSKEYIDKFWELIDEILNIILFVLIGLELLLIKNFDNYWLIGIITIPVVLFARFISILLPSLIVRLQQKMTMKTIVFLTWGGLRGGVSVALALSLGAGMHKNLFIFITYCVVVFSIIVQGLTIEKIVNKKFKRQAIENADKSL
ncbi:sodium:proton antiporter [Panacibacter sp. DH6]|uniref:Sodium:proton antiporter n=1 Tax=Panacibacter microcysteis TaxID=2793269 RepID=A0A931E591_9BACT|nr:sodium:proton antiporter [Panacibacter microcysteis]MBG9377298.1 sodium:proton antiporter [Panacibacter microcysteis]